MYQSITFADGTAITPDKMQIAPGKLFIDGEWRDAQDGQTKPTINPATEEAITEIAQATEADANAAVEAARKAFDEGPWSKMSGHERGRLLMKVGDLILKHGEDLAYRETIDMGKPIAFSHTVDVPLMADLFYYYGGIASQIEGVARHVSPPPTHTPNLTYTLREPLGVVAAITPFNFPMLLSGTKIAPALAAGNTVIHKPASITQLSAIKIAQLLAEAGIPEGVFNLVTGPGGKIGDILVKHPGVNKIAFTGSTDVGIRIIKNSADTLKKVTMELGGKSPNIIFADADLDSAVMSAFFGIFYNKGEICTAGSRLLVERSVYEEVVERLVRQVEQIQKGDPLDPNVLFGPLADKSQFEKVSQYVKYGQEEGAKLRIGGKPFNPNNNGNSKKGFYYEPTIFTDATYDMRIVQEEIFGPVLAVTPFNTEEEAIKLANGTQFGLASGVHTRDIKKAHRVAHAMKAGTCWINTYNLYDVSTPFGGYKASGFGRELGTEVMENYTHTKSIWVDLS